MLACQEASRAKGVSCQCAGVSMRAGSISAFFVDGPADQREQRYGKTPIRNCAIVVARSGVELEETSG